MNSNIAKNLPFRRDCLLIQITSNCYEECVLMFEEKKKR